MILEQLHQSQKSFLQPVTLFSFWWFTQSAALTEAPLATLRQGPAFLELLVGAGGVDEDDSKQQEVTAALKIKQRGVSGVIRCDRGTVWWLGKTSLRKSFINPGVHKTGRCQMCGHLRGERSTQRD